MINPIAADTLVRQGATASAATVLIFISQNMLPATLVGVKINAHYVVNNDNSALIYITRHHFVYVRSQ